MELEWDVMGKPISDDDDGMVKDDHAVVRAGSDADEAGGNTQIARRAEVNDDDDARDEPSDVDGAADVPAGDDDVDVGPSPEGGVRSRRRRWGSPRSSAVAVAAAASSRPARHPRQQPRRHRQSRRRRRRVVRRRRRRRRGRARPSIDPIPRPSTDPCAISARTSDAGQPNPSGRWSANRPH